MKADASRISCAAVPGVRAILDGVRSGDGSERIAVIRKELQDSMDRNAQIFRTDESLEHIAKLIETLRGRYRNIQLQDKGKRFNTDLLEAIELELLPPPPPAPAPAAPPAPK